MSRKSSQKPVVSKAGKPVKVEEKKSCSTSKKPCTEIDEIFAGKKRKKAENQTNNEAARQDKMNKLKKKKRISKGSKESEILDPPSCPRKRTNDGLIIYSEEELGVWKADAGGNSPRTLIGRSLSFTLGMGWFCK